MKTYGSMCVEGSITYKEDFGVYLGTWEVDSGIGSIYVIILKISDAGWEITPPAPTKYPQTSCF